VPALPGARGAEGRGKANNENLHLMKTSQTVSDGRLSTRTVQVVENPSQPELTLRGLRPTEEARSK